jgi:hypothetical protein
MLSLPLLPADAGVVEVFDITRIGVRSTQPLQDTPPGSSPGRILLAGDASTSPGIRLRVGSPHWTAALSYSPSVSETDFELTPLPAPTVSQSGSAAMAWRYRFWALSISETGSYSPDFNSALLYYPQLQVATATTASGTSGAPSMGTGQPTQPPATGGPATMPQGAAAQSAALRVPPGEIIQVGSSNTDASFSSRVGRSSSFAIAGGYALNGGLDTDSRRIYPEQYGGYASVALNERVSRVDTLSLILSGQEVLTVGPCLPPEITICHETIPLLETQATVRHQLTVRSIVSAAIGVAESIVESQAQTQDRTRLVILPIASVGYSAGLDGHAGDQVAVTLQSLPIVDFLSGSLSERLVATAAWVKQVAPGFLVTTSAGLTQSVPFPSPLSDPNTVTILSGGVDARIRLDRHIDLIVSEQDFWQKQSAYGTLGSELGYVGISVHTLPLRF